MSKCIKHRNGRNDSERESERARWKKLSKYFHVVQRSLFYQSLEWDKYKTTSIQSSSEAPYAHLKHEWAMNNQPVEKKKPKRKISTASKRHALITSLSVALPNDIEEKSVSTYSWDLTVLSVSAYVWMCMWKKCTGQKKRKKNMKENSCEPENLNFMKLGMLKQSQASASASTSFEQLIPHRTMSCHSII